MDRYEGYYLPLTLDPWQVFTMDLVIDGAEFHVQAEIRYLPAPDRWFVSLWDHSTGELLVNMIPLVCSYGEPNDLLYPFRHLRNGKGMGSMFCIRGTEETGTPDPSAKNLTDYKLFYGDTFEG